MFCNTYNAKRLLLHLKAFHFDIKNQAGKHVFSRRLPGHLLLDIIMILCEIGRFGVGANIRQQRPVSGVVKQENVVSAKTALSGAKWSKPDNEISPLLPPSRPLLDVGMPQICYFLFLRPPFASPQKQKKKQKIGEIHQHLKNSDLGRQRLQF